MSRLHIRSGGSYVNTTITVVDDDGNEEPLIGVVNATWSIKKGELANMTLEMDAVEVDVVGETP